MSYQVLARKWRPKTFEQVVGQEHVVRAITNALEQQRLHHAYLFTGTRGVGKTTLARIIAKALNCETGITAHPCGVCTTCVEIDKGRFVDLIEVDAASNTQVDAMRDLLDNAQYAPTMGRFKVYIIDEVHMLSRSAFNAMLKTLEEPPAHVKFILATTDPQKVPVTVLSRCLQFNLKQMMPAAISGHLVNILQQENISADIASLNLIAHAAEGSMRDALSLLDQAIAYGAGAVNESEVRSMLGAIDQDYLFTLLETLVNGDGAALLKLAEQMEERSLSFDAALQDLAALLHQIAIAQTMPSAIRDDLPERERIMQLAQKISAEDAQIYFQIAILGKRDLALAPDEFAGFNMTLLRMLAFTPSNQGVATQTAAPARVSQPVSTPTIQAAQQTAPAQSSPAQVSAAVFDGNWRGFTESLKPGVAKSLAQNSALLSHDANGLVLQVPQNQRHLLEPNFQNPLKTALKDRFGQQFQLRIEIGDTQDTPAAQISEEKANRQSSAEESLRADPFVQEVLKEFGATVIPSSIKPIQ
ncbi:MAG TPA: DNA polymerase III subunit gamma/tau [Methylophilaceae bacterium]|jgi:DNA polymerase-3 subunit gamma/tau